MIMFAFVYTMFTKVNSVKKRWPKRGAFVGDWPLGPMGAAGVSNDVGSGVRFLGRSNEQWEHKEQDKHKYVCIY